MKTFCALFLLISLWSEAQAQKRTIIVKPSQRTAADAYADGKKFYDESLIKVILKGLLMGYGGLWMSLGVQFIVLSIAKFWSDY